MNAESQSIFTTPVNSDLSVDQVRERLTSFESDWSFQKLLHLDPEDPQFISRATTVRELDIQADMCVQTRVSRPRGDLSEGLCTGCFKRVTCGDNGFTITTDGQDHFSCVQCNEDPKMNVCDAKNKINEFTNRNSSSTTTTDNDPHTITIPTPTSPNTEITTTIRCSSCVIPPNDMIDANYHPGTRVWCRQRTDSSWTNTFYKGVVQTIIDSYVPSENSVPPRRNRFSYHIVFDNGKHDTIPSKFIRQLI